MMVYLKGIFKRTVLMLLLVASLSVMPYTSKMARASCCGCCSCIDNITDDASGWVQDVIEINIYLFIQLLLNRMIWWDWQFWQLNMLPVFMNMGEQMSAVGMQQVMIIGTFIDAAHLMETQQVLQEMHAKAHKDYHPTIGLCEFGTRIKSLAASERKGELNALAMSERSLDRLLGNTATPAAGGSATDVRYRFMQFQEEFCDVHDEGDRLGLMCPSRNNITTMSVVQKERMNADIDYSKMLQHPLTIGLDMTDNVNINENERELFALANNLYGYSAFIRLSPKSLQNDPGRDVLASQRAYMNLRSTAAKTSVAENSFNAMVGMKSEGTPGSYAFLEAYLEQLGVPSAEISDYLGNNPSYYAQMEILTKKAYQSAQFYTNLYDKPANVARKGVAMQAIGLIQKFDLFKSYLRTEASMSLLLELSVQGLQDEIEDAINALGTSAE